MSTPQSEMAPGSAAPGQDQAASDAASSAMNAEPVEQHRWLQRLLGEWVIETGVPASPGQPAETLVGSETVRQLGELWVLGEGHGPMPGGGEAHTMITLGYDPVRRRFTGTWIGSMMTHLWVYDGELDADGRTLTLSATGPDFERPGHTRQYQDIIEVVDDDTRLFRSRMLGDDGTWQDMMSARYTRRR
jgi:hypothetical protein